MNNTGLYLRLKDIVWYTAVLLGAVYVFGDKMSIGIPQFDVIQKYIAYVLIVDVIYMFITNNRFLNKYTILLFFLFFLFVGGILLSSYCDIGLVAGRNPVTFAKRDLISFTCIFITMFYTAENDRMDQLIKLTAYVITSFCFINDVLILVNRNFGGSTGGVNYFVGTKFIVSYLHMSLIVIYSIISSNGLVKNRRLVVIFLFIVSVLVSIKVDCNTGIIGIALLAIMVIGNEHIKGIGNLLYNRLFYIISLFFILLFVVLVTFILSNSFVQHIIVDVLHRELTLTGRTDIYMGLFPLLANRILYGYGYGNSYTISKSFFGYANTQNGLAEWLLQVGLVGVIPMVLFFCYCIFSIISADKEKEMLPIVSIIYVYNFLGMVEITIDIMYFYWLWLLVGGSYWLKKRKIVCQDTSNG